MEVKPIGMIKANPAGFYAKIDEQYIPALEGLSGFSHCIVFWWADKCDSKQARETISCRKPYKHSPERLGIFATRSPVRPNPIASSVVMILSIESDGTIRLPYIDADDNTPILDIKPYHPSCDRVNVTKLPKWCAHWPQSYEESGEFDWENEFCCPDQ